MYTKSSYSLPLWVLCTSSSYSCSRLGGAPNANGRVENISAWTRHKLTICSATLSSSSSSSLSKLSSLTTPAMPQSSIRHRMDEAAAATATSGGCPVPPGHASLVMNAITVDGRTLHVRRDLRQDEPRSSARSPNISFRFKKNTTADDSVIVSRRAS